jgi:hypothetical protein
MFKIPFIEVTVPIIDVGVESDAKSDTQIQTAESLATETNSD